MKPPLPVGLGVGVSLVLLSVASCLAPTPGGAPSASRAARVSLSKHAAALGLRTDEMIPAGRYGRKWKRPMRPRYITVHSTQNFSRGGNAKMHAVALKGGALKATNNLLGYLTWHFTVDQETVYQSLPVNERGEHADYEGQGNKTSIGIEMCENRGNSRDATVDRTARLCAVLMAEHGIPLRNVVPHYHWERVQPKTGRNIGHKNCPHFLMDNGRPGRRWSGFLARVDHYYKRVRGGRL